MKTLTTLTIALALLSLGLAAHAADEKKPPTAQQLKMRACNADARDNKLKGDARKAFLKTCLSSKPSAGAAPASAAQGNKKG
jgi:hypothetical protein